MAPCGHEPIGRLFEHGPANVPASIYQLELRLSGAQTLRLAMPQTGGQVGSDPDCTIHVDDERIPEKWLTIQLQGDAVTFAPGEVGAGESYTVPIGHWCVLPDGHLRVTPTPRTTYQTAVLDKRLDGLAERGDRGEWAEPFLELAVGDSAKPRRFPISVGRSVKIGRRKSECEVALPAGGDEISRHHASVEWRKGEPILRDHSTNGTFWSRPSQDTSFRGVGGGQPLADGDLIRIGSWTLCFRWPQAALARQLAPTTGRASPDSRTRRSIVGGRRRIDVLFLAAVTLALLCLTGILWTLFFM